MAKGNKAQLSPQEKKVADAKRAEQKAQKFVELARKRMTKALAAIRNVGNLSNRASYNYDSAQVGKISTALAEAVKEVAQRFTATGEKKASGFDF